MEILGILTFIVLALMAVAHLFPASVGLSLRRWSHGLFYGTALIAILAWATLKWMVLRSGQKLVGASS
jgi:hypothetical protein